MPKFFDKRQGNKSEVNDVGKEANADVFST